MEPTNRDRLTAAHLDIQTARLAVEKYLQTVYLDVCMTGVVRQLREAEQEVAVVLNSGAPLDYPEVGQPESAGPRMVLANVVPGSPSAEGKVWDPLANKGRGGWIPDPGPRAPVPETTLGGETTE